MKRMRPLLHIEWYWPEWSWLHWLLCLLCGHQWNVEFWETRCSWCGAVRRDRLYHHIPHGIEQMHATRQRIALMDSMEGPSLAELAAYDRGELSPEAAQLVEQKCHRIRYIDNLRSRAFLP